MPSLSGQLRLSKRLRQPSSSGPCACRPSRGNLDSQSDSGSPAPRGRVSEPTLPSPPRRQLGCSGPCVCRLRQVAGMTEQAWLRCPAGGRLSGCRLNRGAGVYGAPQPRCGGPQGVDPCRGVLAVGGRWPATSTSACTPRTSTCSPKSSPTARSPKSCLTASSASRACLARGSGIVCLARGSGIVALVSGLGSGAIASYESSNSRTRVGGAIVRFPTFL